MVKGISKQVIVVHAPEEKIFEQAIFILRESAIKNDGMSDEMLLKEANALLSSRGVRGNSILFKRLVWALSGALITAAIWGLSAIL